MPEERLGVLFLADVMDYTSQSDEHGHIKTGKFNEFFEKNVKALTKTHGGKFIKPMGDAVLIFFQKHANFLDFVIQLRELSKNRELDCFGFFADLRMVAHHGLFFFKEQQGELLDLIGPEGIKVFRAEGFAKEHTGAGDVVITDHLYAILKENLKARRNIGRTKLGRKKLKGFEDDVMLYQLVFPEEGEIEASNLLSLRMAQLERDTKVIPVFGDLYPSMSMEDNFIDLDVKRGMKEEEEEFYDPEMEKEWLESMDMRLKDHQELRLHLKEHKPKKVSSINVKELYDTYPRGIILGLPGSGKTTILKHFAFREFKENRRMSASQEAEDRQRLVLLVECRNVIEYKEWHRQYCGKEHDKKGEVDFNIKTILLYLTHGFLFKRQAVDRENKELVNAAKRVLRAYNNGCLAVLIDALDEAVHKKVKDGIAAAVKMLLAGCQEERKKGNRIYLTSRFSERERYFSGKNAGVFQPLFEVRALDMEQLRQMADFFYKGKPKLYKAFDKVVWQEEIAAKVGGTPLTALLVIAYFEIFRKFDTRYHMYNIIVIFVLIRVWKQMKEKGFNMDMKTFFREARSKGILKEEKSAREVYDALTLLSYEHMDEGRIINEEDIMNVFTLFAKGIEKEEEAEQWLNRMKEDHLLVNAGAGEYVFVHSTVMEYLAARYVVEKINDPLYLETVFENKEFENHLKEKGAAFFESETLPIAVGSGIETGAKVLHFIHRCIQKTGVGNEKIKAAFYRLALKCLVEFESFIDRQYQRIRLKFLHRQMEEMIQRHKKAVDWVYKYLLRIILSKDKGKLKGWQQVFKNLSRLSRPVFLEEYLSYDSFADGDSETVALREKLLYQMVNRERVDQWLQENKEEEVMVSLPEEVVEAAEAMGSLLTLDSKDYHPEDKNFSYYRKHSGKGLVGFLGSPNLKHSGVVTCVAASPDGKYIISGSYDNTVKLWDIGAGKEIRTFKGHSSYVRSVCLSGDGKHIISGSDDHTVKLWDIGAGKEIRTFYGHSFGVNSVCLSGDGKHIISGSSDHTVKLWDIGAGKEIRTFKGHSSYVRSVCLSGDGKHIISGSSDDTVKLWDIGAGKEIRTFKGHSSGVNSVCLSGDGKHFISGSSDYTVKLWDIGAGKEIRTFNGHSSGVNSVCLSGDGKHIISGSWDNSVKLWDIGAGREIRTFKGHILEVTSVCLSEDGKHIISGSDDHTVKLWDIGAGKEIHTFNGHSLGVNSVCLSGDGKHIISGSSDDTVKLWDIGAGKEIRTFKGHSSGVRSVCLSVDGKHIISGSSDQTVKLWDIGAGKEIRTFKGHSGSISSVCLSGDGKHIISVSYDNTVKLWDIGAGKEIRTFKGHSYGVTSVCLSIDGKHIISGSDDYTLKLWDMETGACLQTIPLLWKPREIKEMPGKPLCFASANANGTVALWDFRREEAEKLRT